MCPTGEEELDDDFFPTQESRSTLDDDDPEEEDGCDDGKLEVTYINVGQGTSILIQYKTPEESDEENQTMLIDAGTIKKGTSDGYSAVKGTLEDKIDEEQGGDEEIDYMIVSHNDLDHTRYIPNLVDDFHVEQAYWSGVDGTPNNNGKVDELPNLDELSEGDEFSLGEAAVDVYHPAGDRWNLGENESAMNRFCDRKPPGDVPTDCNSIVLSVEHEGVKFLFPGDVRDEAKEYLFQKTDAYHGVDVLKVSHHGVDSQMIDEDTSYTPGSFDEAEEQTALVCRPAVSPDIAVISNARDAKDDVGPKTLKVLSDENIGTYWTGVHGNVTITVENGADAPRVTPEHEDGDDVSSVGLPSVAKQLASLLPGTPSAGSMGSFGEGACSGQLPG